MASGKDPDMPIEWDLGSGFNDNLVKGSLQLDTFDDHLDEQCLYIYLLTSLSSSPSQNECIHENILHIIILYIPFYGGYNVHCKQF